MNNEPVAWTDGQFYVGFDKTGICSIPLYTHPAKPIKDREADRKRFSDEGFNRWLDESISDSGHTVYDLVENVCEAWHGWKNSQYYRPAKTLTEDEVSKYWYNKGHEDGRKLAIVKTLTDEEIIKTMVQFDVYSADDQCLIEAGRAILRKRVRNETNI